MGAPLDFPRPQRVGAGQRRYQLAAALAASAEQLPSPLILLSGPAPVRVAYVNPALASIDGRALLYRLPAEPGQSPLVAVVELEHAGERESRLALARLREERAQLDRQFEQHSRWLSSVSELAELFRQESGPALLQATADTFVRRLPPIDVGVAVYMAG